MKKIVVLSLAFAASVILSGCNGDEDDAVSELNGSKNVSSEFSAGENNIQSQPKTEEIAARHETVRTKEDGTDYVSIVEETEDYIINVEIPHSDSSDVTTQIESELDSLERRFKRSIVEGQKDLSELEIGFEKETLNDELIVYTQTAELKNTNADRTFFQTFIEYNDELLEFEDIFDDSVEARELYHHYVLQELKNENPVHLNESSLERTMIRSNNAIDKVYPTEDGLVFQFNTLEVGGMDVGTPKVLVDYANVSHLMTEKCYEILGDVADEWKLEGAFAGSFTPSDYDAFYQVREDLDTDKQLVALTFDDGPVPGTTEHILDTLAEHDVKATFFVLGSMVEAYPEIAKRIVDDGHEIANHSYNHPQLTTLSEENLQYQIGYTQELIQDATGTWAMLFRPPYGDTNQFVRDTAGIQEVLWNIDTLDWQSRNTNLIYNNVMTNVGDGSVILMHDIVDATPQAVVNLMNNLDKDQFEFVTVSEMYEYREEVSSFTQY